MADEGCAPEALQPRPAVACGSALELGLVAGEASGDLLGGLLLSGLRQRWPQLSAWGIGGAGMAAHGLRSEWPMERLSVFGYVDALQRLPELLRIRRELGDRLIEQRPAAFIGIDAPDFNFALERRLREAGLKTLHFVCPSIWAWRGERVHKLAAAADHVLCLFPFEPELLARHGVAASYVGHPLADAIAPSVPRPPARQSLGLASDATIVALMPGSRRSEIRHIAPRLLAAAALMRQAEPGLRFALPVAPGLRDLVQPMLAAQSGLDDALSVFDGRSHEVLAACDIALVASGTAALEAALFKRPMVITYHLAWLNWQRMKRMRYQPWVGLPNILAGEFVVPELIQDAATPQALAREGLAWLNDAPRCAKAVQRFEQMHGALRQDTARRAADVLAQVLGQRPGRVQVPVDRHPPPAGTDHG